MRRNLFTASLCLFILGLYYPTYALGCGLQADNKPVCYYVASNEIRAYGRVIKILMDEVDFTEDNLKALMRHFFEKYPEPEAMEVSVATHLSHLFDYFTSEGPGKKLSQLHPHAGFYRRNGNEIIRYKLPDENLKTIVVKGKDWLSDK